jgi:ribosomal protein S6
MSNTEQRNYQATFVLDTRDITETIDEIVSRLSETLRDIDAEVVKIHNHGIKEFARTPIRGFISAPYVQIDFKSSSEGPASLKEKLRLDSTIDRVVVFGAN